MRCRPESHDLFNTDHIFPLDKGINPKKGKLPLGEE